MDRQLPGLVLTGASGFIGRQLIEALAGRYRLFCLARRSQVEAGIPRHPNLLWLQADIAEVETLTALLPVLREHGGASLFVHLAAYYDFSGKDNPAYRLTNVQGTRHCLELAKSLGVRHFLFASSLAACEFPAPGQRITESTPAAAQYPYATSKREAEALMARYAPHFTCSILRLAAIYSDWCEYAPVYHLLQSWLAPGPLARVLGGRGRSAVPYLHVNDVHRIIHRIIELTDQLPPLAVYNASPSESISQTELYRTATRLYFGQNRRPLFLPKWVATPIIAARQCLLDALGAPPFERLWMMHYIDLDLAVDASATHRVLSWQPNPRYDLRRRLLVMIENMKTHPLAWHLRNSLHERQRARRPNLVLAKAMDQLRDQILGQVIDRLHQTPTAYSRMSTEQLRWYVNLLYQILLTSVRTKDRTPIRNYAQIIALHRFRQGFPLEQVCACIKLLDDCIQAALLSRDDCRGFRQEMHDDISLTLHLATDDILEAYNRLRELKAELPEHPHLLRLFNVQQDEQVMIQQIEDLCSDGWDLKNVLLHG